MCGILINATGAEFMLVTKYASKIKISKVKSFEFDDVEKVTRNFEPFVGFMIGLYNYCKTPVPGNSSDQNA